MRTFTVAQIRPALLCAVNALTLLVLSACSRNLTPPSSEPTAGEQAVALGARSQQASADAGDDSSTVPNTDEPPIEDGVTTFERYMRERQRELAETSPSVPVRSNLEELADPPAPSDNESPFSLQFKVDVTNAYYFRGLLQENDGVIVQPALTVGMTLIENDDFSLAASLNTWNSIHSERTGIPADESNDEFTDYWYEADLAASLILSKGDFTLTTTYILYASPSDVFESIQELDISLAYDDSALLGPWALHPYVLVGIETGADGADGADGQRGTYLEVGIAPGFSFDLGTTPVAVSFPMAVGFSLDNYYESSPGQSDTFGFAQVGVKAAMPLPFGDRFGAWTLNAGASALYLGDVAADINGGDSLEFIATLGVQVDF